MPGTRRQEIARMLRQGKLTLLDVSRRSGASVKAVREDLEHIRRGLKAGERWVAREAECLSCGFVFRGRERLNTPSRCPKCRSEDIQDPAFEIQAM